MDDLTVREACRQGLPLDGADAKALEHALTLTEKERDAARAAYQRQKAEALDAFAALREAQKTVLAAAEKKDEAQRQQHLMQIALQSHDCTYGDTPGLIHCPVDKPCTTHRAERLVTALNAQLNHHKERDAMLQQNAESWRFIATENEKARKRDAEEITRLRRHLGEIP